MRSVIQRVSNAQVRVDEKITGKIGLGLLVLVGIEDEDGTEDIEWLSGKIVNLRIFDDEQGIMNQSVADVNGDLLVVSQFTLHASTRKGKPAHHTSMLRNRRRPFHYMKDFSGNWRKISGNLFRQASLEL